MSQVSTGDAPGRTEDDVGKINWSIRVDEDIRYRISVQAKIKRRTASYVVETLLNNWLESGCPDEAIA